MALISETIPNLINGVSQQPYTLRRSSQAELQENALSSVVDGLVKRPPSEHVAKLLVGSVGDAFVHIINRDTVERYTVIVTNGDLKVFDLEGNAKTVAFPNGKAYLTAANPKQDFKAATIVDYTFLINTGVTVQKDAATATDNGYEAIVFVKQGAYNSTYSVYVDGVQVATHTTGATGNVGSDVIADALETDLIASLGATWTISRPDDGSVIHLYKNDKSSFTISTSDSAGNTYLFVAQRKVQRFTELPTYAPNGFVVEVVGEASSNFDNYYVKFETENGASFGKGVWKESLQQGAQYRLDAATMPHVLVREADGTFTFKVAEWGDRTVGDDDSAPFPSFTGESIKDVLFFRNRLGFLSSQNVVLSRSGEFFEFFRSTVTTLLDTDPIDVGITHTGGAALSHAVPFNEKLLLWSGAAQFVLEGEGLLTPKTVTISLATEYLVSHEARPVPSGKNVYFPVPFGDYSGVMEYFVADNVKSNEAADITSHVPKYILGNVEFMSACTAKDIMILKADGEANTLYVYKYLWDGDEKLQSSWSKWSVDSTAEILGASFVNTTLYLVIQYADGVYLEKMRVEDGRADSGVSYITYLDRRITEAECASVVYDPITNKTVWTLPYETTGEMLVVQRATEGGSQVPGRILNITQGTTTLEARGDFSATPVWIGQSYTMRYRFSTPVIKARGEGGAESAIAGGRLQILRWFLIYANTGYFRVEVTPLYRNTNTYHFTGRILGSGNAVIGQVALEDGTFKVPVMSLNDRFTLDIINDSPLPSNFQAASWEAQYNKRSKSI